MNALSIVCLKQEDAGIQMHYNLSYDAKVENSVKIVIIIASIELVILIEFIFVLLCQPIWSYLAQLQLNLKIRIVFYSHLHLWIIDKLDKNGINSTR